MTPKDTAIPAGASEEWAKNLDDKERLFVEGYLQTLNKRAAAAYAGYTHETAKRFARQISLGAVEGLNNKLKASIRKSYGFRTSYAMKIVLYHKLGQLPEPHFTHRFC